MRTKANTMGSDFLSGKSGKIKNFLPFPLNWEFWSMSDEKKSEWLTGMAIASYVLLFVGIVTWILSVVLNPKITENWADIILLFMTLGVFGFFYGVYLVLVQVNFLGMDKKNTMGMFLAIVVGIVFILTHRYLNILEPIESFGKDLRFRLASGQVLAVDYANDPRVSTTVFSPRAHPAIEIIGIDNNTVNQYQGYPFSWEKYANLLKALDGSKVSTIMFDIFFVDEVKNNYGLLNLSDEIRYQILDSLYNNKRRNIAISYADMVRATSLFSETVKKSKKVVVDYSFETMPPNDIDYFNQVIMPRIQELDRYRINNVVETEYNSYPEWTSHPEPPMQSIGKAVMGMGFANIRLEGDGMNRKMPLVIKWKNNIYPNIDLMMAANYFEIDISKDVEVKLGEYIKIKNIPKKTVKFEIWKDGELETIERDIMTKPNPERVITIPIDEEGFMNINFIGPPTQTFRSQSFINIADAPAGEFGKEGRDPFINKILLVAMYYATGVAKDVHQSPFGPTAGIEHHANALNTILNQDYIYFAPEWLNYIIYLLLAVALGYIVPRYNIKFVIIWVVVFAVAFTAEAIMVFITMQYMHVFFSLFMEALVSLIAIIGYKILTEEENVKYIRSTFSKFVSKDVVNQLLAHPDALKLGGEKKTITVFFSDIRGFTTISESLSPESLVNLLNDYLSEMTEIVLEYKGTVDKYMGDAIMAFWGAPLPMEEHAYTACLASLKQLESLNNLQEKWKDQKLPIINIGIGLNTGDAVVGNMGSTHRMDYTVMGDTVNLGSRLEGTNKVYGTRIIISEYTYEYVKDKIIARELDLIKVKGKNEPVRIYELLDIINQEDFERYRAVDL